MHKSVSVLQDFKKTPQTHDKFLKSGDGGTSDLTFTLQLPNYLHMANIYIQITKHRLNNSK